MTGKDAERDSKVAKEEIEKEEGAQYGMRSLYRYSACTDFLLIAVGLICSVGVAAGMPAINIVFGDLIDDVYTPDRERAADQLMHNAKIFAFIAAALAVIATLQMATFDIVAERQVPRIRTEYFRAILRQDSTFFDSMEHGAMELPASIAADSMAIKDGMGFKLTQAVQCLGTFIISFILAYVWGWQLALLMTAAMPVLAVLMAWVMKHINSSGEIESATYASAGGLAAETLANLRTVVAFGAERARARLYAEGVAKAQDQGLARSTMAALGSAAPMAAMFAVFALAMWFGAMLVTDSDSINSFSGKPWTAGDVLRVFFLMFIGGMMLGQGSVSFTAIGLAGGTAKRIMRTIDRVPLIDSYSDKGKRPTELQGELRFENVSFAYPSRKDALIFSELDLVIEAGQRTALVGGSGSGKSTVIALCERFYDVTAGAITLDGTDIRELSIVWLRQQIGLVSQEPVLFGSATRGTIAENVRYGKPDATQEEVERACQEANCAEFIQKLPKGYDTCVGEAGTQLSGGQKQRIAIARAIIRNPSLMLLDEATSALDTENEKLVKTALDRVMRGRTTIVVAHRLSTIRDADKICVMENGRIVEQGQYASLIDKNGAFKKLVQRQQMDTQASVATASSSRYLARKLSVDEELQAGSSPVLDDATVDEPITATTKGPAKGDEGKKSDSSDDKVEDEPKLGFKQMYERSGSAGPLLYVGCFCSLIMGGQFPAFNYIIAELIKVLTYCFEVSWCVPEVDAATRAEAVQWLQRDLPQEMSALSAATNGSYCPRLTSFGFESPFYLDEEACFDELNDRSRILCLLFLGMAGVVFVAGYVLYKSFGVLSEKIKGTLRTELMETLLTLDMEFYDDDANSAGAMSSRMASDAPIVASGYGISFGAIIQALVTVVLSLIFGFFYNWQLTLVMLAVLPINAVGMSAAMGAVGFVAAAQEKAAAATAIATEAIAGYRTVATFQIQNNVVALFEEEISASAAKSIKQVWITSCMYGILGMGSQIGTNALAFGYGGYLVREGLYTADDIMKVFLVVQGMGAGLAMAMAMMPDKVKSEAAKVALFKLIGKRGTIHRSEELGNAPRPDVRTSDIVFTQVAFAYPSRADATIFDSLQLTLAAGKQTALVGATGCGKSTIVALLQRFYDPSAGSLMVGDVDIRTLPVSWWRSQIGLVSQEPVLFATSVRENVRFGKEGASDAEVEEACRQANAHDFVLGFQEGYDTTVGPKGSQVSGGQKQRIAIARAIIREPSILILDEATSALDTASEQIVQASLDRAKRGRTTVVIAHRLNTIKASDCIVVLGQLGHGASTDVDSAPLEPSGVLEQGTHQELLALKGAYHNLASKGGLVNALASERNAAPPGLLIPQP